MSTEKVVLGWLILAVAAAQAATLEVGPGKKYAKPCQAIAAAGAGDTIEIDSSHTYTGDVCAINQANLTIRGVGSTRAHLIAGGASSQKKGIWVVSESAQTLTVENMEFSGAVVEDRNGAGIRVDPNAGLIVRDCYFHDNQEGILTGDAPDKDVIVENSIFENNGYPDGQAHNIYVNHARKFVFRGNYSTKSVGGQLVKSRAATTYILYNRLTQETGNGSLEVDISNGGLTYIIGNLITQGPSSQNGHMVWYRPEGADPRNPSQQLYVINNTIVNGRSLGSVLDIPADAAPLAVVMNNIFIGAGSTTLPAAKLFNNYIGDPGFVDAAQFNFALKPTSPAVNAGGEPGTGTGFALAPTEQYFHPACTQSRTAVGAIDIGAFEYNSGGASNGPPRCVGSEPIPPPEPGMQVAVTHGASFAENYLTAGAIGTLFGTNLTDKTVVATTAPLPLVLGSNNVSVNFEGVTAPLYFVSPTQINFQVPYGLPSREFHVSVRLGDFTRTLDVPLSTAAPGIFLWSGTGNAIAQNQDYSLNTAEHGAPPGNRIIVYLSGQGMLDHAVYEGVVTPSSPLARAKLDYSATIGGVDAKVEFLGLTPGLVGLAQSNIVVPQLDPGVYDLILTVDGHPSNAAKVFVSAP